MKQRGAPRVQACSFRVEGEGEFFVKLDRWGDRLSSRMSLFGDDRSATRGGNGSVNEKSRFWERPFVTCGSHKRRRQPGYVCGVWRGAPQVTWRQPGLAQDRARLLGGSDEPCGSECLDLIICAREAEKFPCNMLDGVKDYSFPSGPTCGWSGALFSCWAFPC